MGISTFLLIVPSCGSHQQDHSHLRNLATDGGSSGILMKNRRALTGKGECSSMGSGLKDRPDVAENRQKPSKIRFITNPASTLVTTTCSTVCKKKSVATCILLVLCSIKWLMATFDTVGKLF